MNPTISPMAPSPLQATQAQAPAQQAAQAPMFGARNPFGGGSPFDGNPLDNFDPQQVADKLEDKVRSNPKLSAALDVVKRLLAGDTKVVDEQLNKLLTPVNGLVEQVRAFAGDQVADDLKKQIDTVVKQASSQTAVVQTLPLLVDPVIERLKAGIEDQTSKLSNPEALEKLEAQFDAQIEQINQQKELVTDLVGRAPELSGKATELVDAIAGKLGLRNDGGLGGLGSLLGGLLGGNKKAPTEQAPQEPQLSAEQQAALEKLLNDLLNGGTTEEPKQD